MKRNIIVLIVILLVLTLVMSTGCAKAAFEVSSLEITPSRVATGDTATVKVDVTNVGKAEGTYTATLSIDGVLVETKDVIVPAATTLTVTFSVVKEIVGDYTAEVGGLTGTIHVVKPAAFEVTNLQVVLAPELGEGYYHITVDVENTGGLPGVYQLGGKVNDAEMELVKMELTAGEKKTVALAGAESTIRELSTNYKNGVIEQGKHVISVGGLSETVTFPARPVPKSTYTPPPPSPTPTAPPKSEPVVKLQVLSLQPTMEEGSYVRMTGEVKNISDESLADVEVVVWLFSDEGLRRGTIRALIDQNPLSPGKKSRFEVEGYVDATITKYWLYFRFLSGDTIPHKVERE